MSRRRTDLRIERGEMVRFGLSVAATALIVAAFGCGGGSTEKQPEVIATLRATASPTPSPAATASPAPATTAATSRPTSTPSPSDTPTPAANRNPSFPQGPLQGVSTSYVRDADNVITSAETTMLCPTATDPDGDTLTYTWAVTTGTISSTGLQASWAREIIDGHESPGMVTVTSSDGKGGTGTLTVDFQ